MIKAPIVLRGKFLRFEETFVAPNPQKTKEDAMYILESIREAHPESKGWVELDYDIQQTPSGYVAIRHHAQYR